MKNFPIGLTTIYGFASVHGLNHNLNSEKFLEIVKVSALAANRLIFISICNLLYGIDDFITLPKNRSIAK